MERRPNRKLWISTLAVTVLAGITAGRLVSAHAAAMAAAQNVSAVDRLPSLPDHLQKVTGTVDPVVLASVFGVHPPAGVESPGGLADAGLGPVTGAASRLPASLVATVVTEPARFSLALIRDDARRELRTYAVGDWLMETAEVMRVERRRVLLRHEGRTEVLEIGLEAGPAAAPEAPRAGAEADGGIEKRGPHAYVIAKAEVEKALTNLNELAKQARIVPSFENGVANGFEILRIRPGSLYSRIGLENGDVIRTVNGYDMSSPDRVLEIYSRLLQASRVEVGLERRGRSVKQTYDLVP